MSFPSCFRPKREEENSKQKILYRLMVYIYIHDKQYDVIIMESIQHNISVKHHQDPPSCMEDSVADKQAKMVVGDNSMGEG